MKPRIIMKICVDIAMSIVLLLLMAYSLIGETAHEWIGIGMFILFLMHHILNSMWSKNIFKGKYTVLRIWQTVLVIAVLVCMAGSMISGVILSRHVFSFLPIQTGQSWARTMHLLCAYWGLVMMSIHIGFHFSLMIGMIRKHAGKKAARYTWLIRIAAAGIAVYGVIAFVKREIGSYMFLKNKFVFFDYEEPILLFFADYIAVMGLFVFIGHYFTEFLKWVKLRRKSVKDFQLRNDTKLLLRNNPVEDLTALCSGKNVLFVYGGGSVKTNGCYNDVTTAVTQSGGKLYELGDASREFEQVEKGIRLAKEHQVNLVIGAGGASIMDCAKLIAFGVYHTDDLWEYVKMQKNPYGLEKLPLVLMPTYPSSGSEYGLGAVTADKRTGEFGTAYGIPADIAILVPKYALSLSTEMTAYTGAVTLVQLSAATIGDLNPVSYHMGISVIKEVLNATQTLKKHPDDLTARGTIFYGASISTSGRLGLGKEENYAYDIYEVEFVPEILFDAAYRKSLTTIFPRFLKAMSVYHEEHIKRYFYDAFGFEGSIDSSVKKMIDLFTELGIDMYFDGDFKEGTISSIDIGSMLSENEIVGIMRDCLRTK